MSSQFIRNAVALAAASCVTAFAQAAVLTFEDLPSGRDFFTSTYHGFNFGNNVFATNDWFWTNGQPDFNDPTGDPSYNVFYTPNSGTFGVAVDTARFVGMPPPQAAMAITSLADIVFQGAYFSSGTDQDPTFSYGDTIQYELYLDGNLVHTSATSGGLVFPPTFVASGYAGLVDQIVILSNNQGFYLMDDLTFQQAEVPEPASLGLALFALLGAGAASRRRKTQR